jgi:CheY-like chemotaxis protein
MAREARRVLVMDDNPDVREVTALSLDVLGYASDVVADGPSAIAAVRDAIAEGRPFDAVIMDLRIPGGMSGIDTLRHLHAVAPSLRAIASTGWPEEAVQAQPGASGFRATLSKPWTIETLEATLASALTPDD